MTDLAVSERYRRAVSLAGQPPVFAERMRATVLSWQRGSAWFDGWPLDPGPHSHPGATELFVVLEGAFELSVGTESHLIRRGEVCLVPPDAVHQPVGNGDTDLAVVSIVSPNRKGLRFKTSDFPASALDKTPERGSTATATVPSNHQLESEAYTLLEGQALEWEGRRDVDRILLVIEGEVDIRVAPLQGRLAAGTMVFVPARAHHSIVARGPAPAVVLATWGTGLDAE